MKYLFAKGHKINVGRKFLDRKSPPPMSDVTKEKLRRVNLDKKLSKEHIKKIVQSNKTRWTIEMRLKKSITRKGSKNYNWKGGISPKNERIRKSIEYRLWREAVFARDSWTCQKYEVRGGRLHPHHIKNFSQYPELRFAINNGVTLSEKAHREFHKKYGTKNNTEEQLKEFLYEK